MAKSFVSVFLTHGAAQCYCKDYIKTHQMNRFQLFLGTLACERFHKVRTKDIAGVVSSKIPVIRCMSHESIVINHEIQTVAFIVWI